MGTHSLTPLAYSIAEACAVVGLGRDTLYDALRKGDLRARKVGRRTLVLHEELQAWLRSRPDQRRAS